MAVIHCNAQTAPTHVLQKLSQTCMVITTNTGRVYKPKECERLILYLKDLNLPKPDKWGTSQLVAFVQQVRRMPLSFEILQEMIRFESIRGIPSESTINLHSNIQIGWINHRHKRTRRGGGGLGGGGPPNFREIFKNQPISGKFFSISRAKMLANNGLCVGPPPRFFRPVRL